MYWLAMSDSLLCVMKTALVSGPNIVGSLLSTRSLNLRDVAKAI